MNTFTMNRFSLLLPVALLATATAMAQTPTGNIAVNANGDKPAATAILDVSSTLKGLLIPRVTLAQRTSVALCGVCGAAENGLTVYQTTAPNDGFYYWDNVAVAWVRIAPGASAWDIVGNTLNAGTPAADYFGTSDGRDVVFKTVGVERMRLAGNGANAGNLGIGTTLPLEKVDVAQALRIYAPALGPVFAATQQQGVIKFHPSNVAADTLKSSTYNYPGPPVVTFPTQPLIWSGHYGNIDGTVPVAAGATPHSGGWRRMENEYEEIQNANYTQQGNAVCQPAPGNVEIPNPGTVPLTYSRILTAAQREFVSPFLHNTAGPGQSKEYRQQFMFLQGELNTELNQLNGVNGTPSPTSTNGLGTCFPITAISFWVDTLVVAALQKTWTYGVLLKHAPLGVSNLSVDFDVSSDPAVACVSNALAPNFPTGGGPGWVPFTFSTPFQWDGVRNIIVEVAVRYVGGQNPVPPKGVLPVKFSTVPGIAPANQLTRAMVVPVANYGVAACNPVGGSICAVGVIPANFVSNPPPACATTAGSSNLRPVVRFTGGFTTAPVATTSTGNYMLYKGAFISESTLVPFPWGRWLIGAPLGQGYAVFQGPGTLSAEKGVFDFGVRLSDHVFDRAFDGKVNGTDAATFGNGRTLSIDEMADFTKQNRHLPTMKGRDDWRVERGFSLGDLTEQLWATTETQALYTTQLHDRLNVIELLSDSRPLTATELVEAKRAVAVMGDLTEGEKGALINDLAKRTVNANELR